MLCKVCKKDSFMRNSTFCKGCCGGIHKKCGSSKKQDGNYFCLECFQQEEKWFGKKIINGKVII